MTRVVLDVADVADLELLAEAAEAVASQRRVAAELFAAELTLAKAAGEDVRTRSVRAIEVLGEAGRLVAAAAALRSTTPAPRYALADAAPEATEPATSAASSAQERPAAPAGSTANPKRSRARRAPASAEPDPVALADPQAAETLANLRAAGDAALGPDAGHAPDPEERSEVPEPTADEVPA